MQQKMPFDRSSKRGLEEADKELLELKKTKLRLQIILLKAKVEKLKEE